MCALAPDISSPNMCVSAENRSVVPISPDGSVATACFAVNIFWYEGFLGTIKRDYKGITVDTPNLGSWGQGGKASTIHIQSSMIMCTNINYDQITETLSCACDAVVSQSKFVLT